MTFPEAVVKFYREKTNLLMVLLLLVFLLFNFFIGERNKRGGGFGWDGIYYGVLAKDWSNTAFVEKKYFLYDDRYRPIDSYKIKRIVPSGIVHYGMRLFRVPFENENIIKGFLTLNMFCFLLVAYCWGVIADTLGINYRGKWLGFIGFFVNFLMSFNLYFTVLTDATAFALGMLALTFYLKNRSGPLLAVIAISAFTWPSMPLLTGLLYIFPAENAKPAPARRRLNVITGLTLGIIVIISAVYVHFRFSPGFLGGVQSPSVFYLSVALAAMYMYLGSATLLNGSRIFETGHVFKAMRPGRLAALMALIVPAYVAIHLAYQGGTNDPMNFTKLLFSRATAQPFVFGISHVLYFGPLVLLTFLLWKEVSGHINKFGVGLTLFTAITLFMGLNSESRQITNCWPVILVFTIKAFEERKWKAYHYWAIGVLSFVYSKLWLRFGEVVLDEKFPQKLFSAIGFLMSAEMYLLQGAIVLITGTYFYFLLNRNRNPSV